MDHDVTTRDHDGDRAAGDAGRPADDAGDDGRDDAVEIVRSEEEVRVDRTPVERGRLRLRKQVVTEPVVARTERAVEHPTVDRVPAEEDDDGEVHVLEDGRVSIPVLEEEVVVTRRVVVKERVVVGTDVELEPVEVETELRRESLDVDVA